MRSNKRNAVNTSWANVLAHGILGILFIVLAFCFGVRVQNVRSSDLPVLSTASTNISNQSSPNILEYNKQKSFTYKTKVKKKIKVRYRAMYCYLRLSPNVATKRVIAVAACTVFSCPDDFLHEQFAYSFTLRGPPAVAA